MSNTDSNINIRVTSSADTKGIDEANKALDEMQEAAKDSGTIDEIVSPAAIETVTATTEAFGELADETRDLDARLQQAARSYMATGTSAERAMGTIVLSYDRTASAAKTAQAAVYSLQQAISEVSSTGTIGLGVSPEQVQTVEDTTAAYEDLAKQIADVKQELQQQAKEHKATRAAAEQSAGGIVGAYKRAKAAVMTVKGAINSVMWWMAAANQAVELIGKAWDFIQAKSRAAKAAADQQADAEEKAWVRTKALEQAVYDELSARKKAAREMEQARVNRTYEDRIKYIERAMELEAVLAQIKAAKTDDQYAIAQAQLQRDLATQAITQAEYDEKARKLEVDHNEELRKQQEENAATALRTAKEQARVNREAYEAQMQRLRKLKEAAGTVYHDYNIMGQRFSVGFDPAKSKVMTPEAYNKTVNNKTNADTSRGNTRQEIADLKEQLENIRKPAAGNSSEVFKIWEKQRKDKLDAIRDAENRLKRIETDFKRYDELIRQHQETLLAFGKVDKKDGDPERWTKGAAVFTEEMRTLSNTSGATGSVSAAFKTMTESAEKSTKAQMDQTAVIEINNSARERDAKLTAEQRAGRDAEQGRETERLGREAQVAGAQKTVTDLQRTAEQQQQAAKAQQEVIDRIVKDSADKDFKTFIDRMEAAIAQQSNEGGYRDRLQQALEMFKGYASASPEQLAGKMDEMTEVLKRVTLPYSMTGPQDMAAFNKLADALLSKAALGNQMRGTAQQQQTAGNNLTEVRDATSAVDAADAGVQGMTNAVTAVATAARALRDKSASPEVQDDLDAIAAITQDGIVAANETGRLEDALQSLAIADKEAYAAITGRMQDVLGLVSDQLPTLQAIPPWAGKVGTRIQQLRDSYTNMQGAMATGMSTLP